MTFKRFAALIAVLFCAPVYAQLDLATQTNTVVATMDALGLPVLILAIMVGVFGYWFRFVQLGFAGAIIIGGILFANAPEIAGFLLGTV